LPVDEDQFAEIFVLGNENPIVIRCEFHQLLIRRKWINGLG
jgi:hypothetical protein